jgi:hypothetical protein
MLESKAKILRRDCTSNKHHFYSRKSRLRSANFETLEGLPRPTYAAVAANISILLAAVPNARIAANAKVIPSMIHILLRGFFSKYRPNTDSAGNIGERIVTAYLAVVFNPEYSITVVPLTGSYNTTVISMLFKPLMWGIRRMGC